jgi:hypothetical protein
MGTVEVVIGSVEEHVAAVLAATALRARLALSERGAVEIEVEDLDIWILLLGHTAAEAYPWTLAALPRRASTLRKALLFWTGSGRVSAAAARSMLATNWPGDDRGKNPPVP